jgi:hypothetical protein
MVNAIRPAGLVADPATLTNSRTGKIATNDGNFVVEGLLSKKRHLSLVHMLFDQSVPAGRPEPGARSSVLLGAPGL